MKYSILVLFAFFAFVPFAHSQSKGMDDFTVRVDGLGCPFCAYGLEKKFKELKGIKKIKIEMETGVFTFSYPEEHALTIDRVEKQVELAGYTPVKTEVMRANGIQESSEQSAVLATNASMETTSFHVSGNCGMCKARIEKAASQLVGVAEATWNVETKQLTLKFDSKTTSKEKVAEAIAKAGHDTKLAKASEKKYESLPACCLYRD